MGYLSYIYLCVSTFYPWKTASHLPLPVFIRIYSVSSCFTRRHLCNYFFKRAHSFRGRTNISRCASLPSFTISTRSCRLACASRESTNRRIYLDIASGRQTFHGHTIEAYLLEFCLEIHCHHMTAMLDDCHVTNQFLLIRKSVMNKVSIHRNTGLLTYFSTFTFYMEDIFILIRNKSIDK